MQQPAAPTSKPSDKELEAIRALLKASATGSSTEAVRQRRAQADADGTRITKRELQEQVREERAMKQATLAAINQSIGAVNEQAALRKSKVETGRPAPGTLPADTSTDPPEVVGTGHLGRARTRRRSVTQVFAAAAVSFKRRGSLSCQEFKRRSFTENASQSASFQLPRARKLRRASEEAYNRQSHTYRKAMASSAATPDNSSFGKRWQRGPYPKGGGSRGDSPDGSDGSSFGRTRVKPPKGGARGNRPGVEGSSFGQGRRRSAIAAAIGSSFITRTSPTTGRAPKQSSAQYIIASAGETGRYSHSPSGHVHVDPDDVAPKAEPTRGFQSGRVRHAAANGSHVGNEACSNAADTAGTAVAVVSNQRDSSPKSTRTEQAQQRARDLRAGVVITEAIRTAEADAMHAGGVFLTADVFLTLLAKVERLEGGVKA